MSAYPKRSANGNGRGKQRTKAPALAKHKVDANAFEKLPADPTAQELRSAAINVSLADLEDRVADVRDSWETDSLFEDVIDGLAEAPAQVAARKYRNQDLQLPPCPATPSPFPPDGWSPD